MSMSNYVKIFDTTLRDGEQSPGASMTSTEKLELARNLARLGVDIIEAGFPAASPDDLEAVRLIANEVGNPPSGEEQTQVPVICGLARATRGDIDKAWEAVKGAQKPRIHTFLATSEIHMKQKLRMDREQVVEQAAEMVAYARSLCDNVEFSPEDAGRSDPNFLYIVLGEAIKAGATTLNIPDTVGYTMPEEFGALIAGIIANTSGMSDEITISVHTHDDLGLATANALAGIHAGARQAEVTINGIGERAGNTSLEEVVMALKTRFPVYALETGIDTTQISRLSKLVSKFTGIPVQPNKAIVGANAFTHEAGIHQDGMLKSNQTYEIMRPEDVGVNQTQLVLGKHSGRHALRVRLAEMGHVLDEVELDQAFTRFKELTDRKKVATYADLEALIADEFYQPLSVYTLDGLQVTCGTMGMPTATVRLKGPDGEVHTQASIGTGPVDATYKAINTIVNKGNTLIEFNIHAITEGIDALGEVTVRIQGNNGHQSMDAQKELSYSRIYSGHGADTDIIVASAKAYINALNKLFILQTEMETVRSV
ncbi:MAG: 2-isopropylmalate synthase [Chloroflexi bacterium GWB2_49_20]|nr:MAG: 2-isopropylmalate synthase [Chloroflexi bacterium GWB2_49_20]OGN76068.1 MAG: 2-isopropylmalate synthase [Chloroflexi bacterium GWC2_49_37]OGN83454.1 MAG: 2-isopropylmalate synthase [Chloroflexi bacterium GWD2_49_16]HBG73852.1 2-isopropylmalate synthase [Anaerolineae bacterium]HCC79569.1 2-isopropylmalate synthase [Anaerolineae bacterium]